MLFKNISFRQNAYNSFIEKDVFNCLEDEDGEYDELEDDFLLLANEGKPALIKNNNSSTNPDSKDNKSGD